MASANDIGKGDKLNKQRLLPLLKKLLDENRVPQLKWVNKEQKIWQMPWKFGKQTRWGDPDAFMLGELAKDMYKYDGDGEPAKGKLKHWKELIRNGLRSLDKHVKQLDDMNVREGDTPFKVYQFLDKEEKNVKRGQCKRPEEPKMSRSDGSQYRSPETVADYSIPAVGYAVNFNNGIPSYQSPVVSTNASNALYNNVQFPSQTNTSCVALFDDQNHYPIDNSSTQGFLPWIPVTSKHCNTQSDIDFLDMDSQVSSLVAFSPLTQSSVDSVSENVSSDMLDQLVSDLKLANVSNLPSIDFPYRSRSPLNHCIEPEIYTDSAYVNGNKENGVISTRTGRSTVALTDVNTYLRHSNSQKQAGNWMEPYDVSTFQDVSGNIPNFIMGSGNEFLFNNGACRSPFQNDLLDLNRKSTVLMDNTIMRNIPVDSATVSSSSAIGDLALSDSSFPLCKTVFVPQDINIENFHSISNTLKSAPSSSLVIAVYYNAKNPVKSQIISGKFRICFVPDDNARECILQCPDPQQFGPNDAAIFELPDVEERPELKNTKKVLPNLMRGVIIDLRNLDIYATRYCKAVLHYCILEQTPFQKMERNQEVKIFDFRSNFIQTTNQQCQNGKPCVRLVFAMKEPNKKSAALTVDIWHVDAYKMTFGAAENSLSLEPDLSISDQFDKRLGIEMELRNSQVDLYTSMFQ